MPSQKYFYPQTVTIVNTSRLMFRALENNKRIR